MRQSRGRGVWVPAFAGTTSIGPPRHRHRTLISAEALLESDSVSRQPGESRYVNFTDPNFLGGRRSAWSAGPGRVVYYQCLTPEQEERRKWGGGVCIESISVMWSSDEHGALTHVDGATTARAFDIAVGSDLKAVQVRLGSPRSFLHASAVIGYLILC